MKIDADTSHHKLTSQDFRWNVCGTLQWMQIKLSSGASMDSFMGVQVLRQKRLILQHEERVRRTVNMKYNCTPSVPPPAGLYEATALLGSQKKYCWKEYCPKIDKNWISNRKSEPMNNKNCRFLHNKKKRAIFGPGGSVLFWSLSYRSASDFSASRDLGVSASNRVAHRGGIARFRPRNPRLGIRTLMESPAQNRDRNGGMQSSLKSKSRTLVRIWNHKCPKRIIQTYHLTK